MTSTSSPSIATHAHGAEAHRRTAALLACGIVAGPLFVAVVLAQALTRSGFDPRLHPLSLLSLGELGWIQIANFMLTGLLVLASAVGMRRALPGDRAATWGPRLIGIYGVALVWAGVFVADPADGYPTAASADPVTWHGMLHNLAPIGTSLALIVACLVFARRFAGLGQRGWAASSVATAAVSLVLGAVAVPAGDFRLMLLGGAAIWLWAAAVTAHIRNDVEKGHLA
jgi:hypothetical protein